MAFSVIINIEILRLPINLDEIIDRRFWEHGVFGNSQFENMMEKKIDDLSSRTDSGKYFSFLSGSSEQCGNTRLQGTPNRANARPGAHEARRWAAALLSGSGCDI